MNDAIYVFNEKNITMNVCIQIRAVVDIIQKRLDMGFAEAVDQFYSSQTYEILQDVKNGFWAESPEYIADRFMKELNLKVC